MATFSIFQKIGTEIDVVLGSSDEFELKFPELSRAELGHLNFWAETKLTMYINKKQIFTT